MTRVNRVQSVEPNIADLVNGWLQAYGLDYKLEQESLNNEIDNALSDYYSKSGGKGGNRPDVKLLLRDSHLNFYPVLIEYKGYKDSLVKLNGAGQVANITTNNEPHLTNINNFAVNGAVHYANALLHHTSYTDIIAIGVTGYKNSSGKLQHEIGVYYVSKTNLGVGQEIGVYSDLSFLAPKHFDEFSLKVQNLQLTQDELEKIKIQREKEIDASLVRLNNDIYQNEKGLGESDRVYLVAASIIATLGVPGKVAPLEKSDLKSSNETGNRDGDIIFRKIKAFLKEKQLPVAKRELILRTLQNTLMTDNINKVVSGESQLKRVFTKIVDDLGIYYKIGLTTDFTGKLFNEMYGWLGFSQDKLNDVVLTPSYVAVLLARLARVNKDSYVWDFATGSAGLLVAAMNEMLIDAKNSIQSPEELLRKEAHIKANQLLGLEVLPNVYMLAILNMILMGDGSSNILNEDSLLFDGNYGLGEKNKPFPATAFILNPPYSAEGNGMVFVEKALSMMSQGYASVIVQGSAGSGKAKEINKRILIKNTLIASIKMPADLFVGKSNVQTFIYVFKVNEPHHKDEMVKFIDFSNDGYTRSNRRRSASNLRNTDRALERYDEVVNLVRFGKSKLSLLTKDEYHENNIDPTSGGDWNQPPPIDTKPTLSNFKETVGDFLSWEVSNLIKQQDKEDETVNYLLTNMLENIEWEKFRLGELFRIKKTRGFNANSLTIGSEYDYVTRTANNQGVLQTTGFVEGKNMYPAGVWSLGLLQMTFFYRQKPWYAGQFIRQIVPEDELKKSLTRDVSDFFTAILNQQSSSLLSVLVRDVDKKFENTIIKLPVSSDGQINFDFMSNFMKKLKAQRFDAIENYLSTARFE